MRFGYDYFCSSNVTVEVGGTTALEVAGMSVNITEGRVPIYGYSSRHWDAVARGRVIVQGTLLLNYVDQDYLWHVMQVGFNDGILGQLQQVGLAEDAAFLNLDSLDGPLENVKEREIVKRELATNYPENVLLAESFKRKWWDIPIRAENRGEPKISYNPHDIRNQVDIKVVFGEQNETSWEYGDTGYVINSVYFVGRSQTCQIDGGAVLEEIPFIARNITSFPGRYRKTNSVEEFSQRVDGAGKVVDSNPEK